MALIHFMQTPVFTVGELPEVGSAAPDFLLTSMQLKDFTLADFQSKRLLLNIFPCIDTPTCALSVKRFNQENAQVPGAIIANISVDSPFAFKRFCATEGLDNALALSDIRQRNFGEAYGLRMKNGPLAGFFARAIVIINEAGQISYTQLVPQISEEPDYQQALQALQA